MHIDIELLKKLTQLSAVSGEEDRMISFMRDEMAKYLKRVRVDNVGNVIGHIVSSEAKKTLMITSHMDQVSLIVKKIEESGLVRFERIGGLNQRSLLTSRVKLVADDESYVRKGVIGCKPYHLTSEEERYKIPPVSDLYIDVGAQSRDQALKWGIKLGSKFVFDSSFETIDGNIIFSGTLDNRCGCLLLLELLSEVSQMNLSNINVLFVGTVQEEIQTKSAIVVVNKYQPDFGICVDSTVATDTPDVSGECAISLGKGPSLTLYDMKGVGFIPNPKLTNFIVKIADEQNIPLQFSLMRGLVTEASYFEFAGKGVVSAITSYPLRYIHSPSEMCCISDLVYLKKLLLGIIQSLDRTTDDFNRG